MIKIGLRQGQPYVAIIYLLGIVMIAIAFLVLFEPLKITYEFGAQHEASQADDFQLTFLRLRTIMTWLPFLLAVPFIIWGFIKLNEKPDGF